MWYGNAATDINSNEPIAFDASAFYAHNECMRVYSSNFSFHAVKHRLINVYVDDVRTMRPDVRFKFGRRYLKAYHSHYPIASPEEDHADRNILYSW